jgi:(R,R)-butanediol dehydrogenase / meso-butanediol dehydrogenase / diacetyl reductase
MRGAFYVGDQTFELRDLAPRPPGPGEVQLAVAYVGICGTDVHIKHGAMDGRVGIPEVIGHEMSGTVAALGDGVGAWRPGDRVTVMPLDWCGRCHACRAGHQHVCQNLIFVGIDAPGAMQQIWTVPERLLVRLPAEMELERAALTEPTAVAVHDVRRGGVKRGDRVLVVGGGPIGLLIGCVAALQRANVVISEPSAFRRSVAEQIGLRAIDPAAGDLETEVREWTGGAGADVAFEVSGSAAGLRNATQVLRVRGRLVVVAIHPQPVAVDLFRVFWRELELAGARVYERRDFERAVELLAAGALPTARLISDTLPLERTAEAFSRLERGAEVVKVLIDCRSRP